MPQKNKKARWAKAHQVPGSKFFSKDYIDSVEDVDDPDYIDEDSCSVSDGEGWIVSLPEHGITDSGAISDSEGKREEASTGDMQSCEVSDEEEGIEEFEAHQILTAAQEFWQKVFAKPVNHLNTAPLKGKGSYTAIGTAKLSNFFQCSTSIPHTAQPTIEVDQSDSTSSESDTPSDIEDQGVNPLKPPAPPTRSHDTAPELLSDTITSNNNSDIVPEAASFLDPIAEEIRL
ncbi:uncharacterized protein EDB91DRAFT_1244679 [Suillus paluster]|uniref:uncharacterized protein n=1 Tax=Suillus paluster TaxID=48578 RepID=UPI001B876103|nr:uncharacterized protein EDB91DRAFT_1244679 [Suillus paluster]KAG1748867.1 hypothetical protein EDB91DRAFT_1244679 [Suillus paluster]